MKLRGIRYSIVSIPLERPIISCVRRTDRVINVVIEVDSDAGVSGLSYVAGFTPHKARAVCAMLDDLSEVLKGIDPRDTGAAWDRGWDACTLVGHTGIAAFALSAIDIALWDLLGKTVGAPVHRLLGTKRHRVEAYASDGCWLGTPSAVASEAAAAAAAGFCAVKVRAGRPSLADDLATLDAVRSEVGQDMGLMVDVNQGWTRERAMRAVRRLDELDLTWLEEPLPAGDVDGLASLRAQASMPITAGENAYMPDGIRRLIEQRAIDVVMPDLQRVGGITGWVRASALAETWNLPVTSHLFPEVSVHLLAASHTAGLLEWVDWARPLFREPLTHERGTVAVPDRPGLGIELDASAIARYRID